MFFFPRARQSEAASDWVGSTSRQRPAAPSPGFRGVFALGFPACARSDTPAHDSADLDAVPPGRSGRSPFPKARRNKSSTWQPVHRASFRALRRVEGCREESQTLCTPLWSAVLGRRHAIVWGMSCRRPPVTTTRFQRAPFSSVYSQVPPTQNPDSPISPSRNKGPCTPAKYTVRKQIKTAFFPSEAEI